MSHESAPNNDKYGDLRRAIQEVGGHTVTNPEGHEVGVYGGDPTDWLKLEHLDKYATEATEQTGATIEEFLRYMARQPFE